MTAWHTFRAMLATCVAMFPIALGLGFAAIWTGSDRLGATAALAAGSGVFLLLACGVWASEGMPNRPMPRAERKKLREEEARIEFDRKVRQAEIDAGLL